MSPRKAKNPILGWIDTLELVYDKIKHAEIVPYQYISSVDAALDFLRRFSKFDAQLLNSIDESEFYILYEDWTTRYANIVAITTDKERAEAWVNSGNISRYYTRVGLQ